MSPLIPLGVLGQMADDLGRQLSHLQGKIGPETDQRDQVKRQAGDSYKRPVQASDWG